MAADIPDDLWRWTARRRSALGGKHSQEGDLRQEAARKHGLTVAEIEEWKERAVVVWRTRSGLVPRTRRDSDQEIKRLKQKVGELVLDLSGLKHY